MGVSKFSDKVVADELKKTSSEVESDARKLSESDLKSLDAMNKAFDEYILRQMRFKSEVIDEIAKLHENAAYAILGIDKDATDDEIKKAYRQTARMSHPDKGGDKEEFQELNNAYEKIMGQRCAEKKNKKSGDDDDDVDFEAF